MKSTFSRMTIVAVTVWLGLAAGTANAGTPTISDWDGSAYAGYNAILGNNGVSSVFNDSISFSMPFDASGNGDANVIRLGGGGIVFTAFNLYDNAILIAAGTMDGILSFTGASTLGNYSLNIAGYKINSSKSASYTGNIAISAVPEPETYAMILAGLGLIGFSIRRRRTGTFN